MKICLKKTFNRAIAAALSIGILGNIAIPYVDAKENKFETFVQKHPGVAISAIIIGGAALAIGAGVGVSKLSELAHIRSIHLKVDDMTDAEVEEELNKEIEKFENYGKVGDKKYFVVCNEIREKADKRVLLLIVNALLQLFENEKCGFLADVLKDYLKKKNQTFEIKLMDSTVAGRFDYIYSTRNAVSWDYKHLKTSIGILPKERKSLYQIKKRSQDNLSFQREVLYAFGDMLNVLTIKSQLCFYDTVANTVVPAPSDRGAAYTQFVTERQRLMQLPEQKLFDWQRSYYSLQKDVTDEQAFEKCVDGIVRWKENQMELNRKAESRFICTLAKEIDPSFSGIDDPRAKDGQWSLLLDNCFAELLENYIIRPDDQTAKDYSNDTFLMQVFERYMDKLKENYKGSKSMFYGNNSF